MNFREKSEELVEDRVFLGIFLTGVLLSFIFSVNNKSFPVFLGFFFSGSFVSLLAAVSWRGIETGYLKILAVLAVFLVSGSAGLFYLQGQFSCVAWSAHSAENPVTNTCHAYVYGGCGPTPEPWYYSQCSPESEERLCDRLDQLHEHLCTDTPKLEFNISSYDRENETITFEVIESTVNSSNTEILKLADDDRNFTLKADGGIYNHSILVGKKNRSIFGESLEGGDEFTVLRDGDDLDGDGVDGADSGEDMSVFYSFNWRNNGNWATAGFEYGKPESDLQWVL